MNVVVAIDSLKGSLSSMEAGRAAGEGIRRAYPEADVIICPLADGGEGTVEALAGGADGKGTAEALAGGADGTGTAEALAKDAGGKGTTETFAGGAGGRIRKVEVTGPLGEKVTCKYGVLAGHVGVIEIAEAAGLALVPPDLRNPLHTTTYGVGEAIKDAIANGCRKFIIGLGGSATNDGGIGMLQALGFEFSDKEGKPVAFGAKGLENLASISLEHALPQLKECEFHVACDVENPLCGHNGCSAVFGPQKGADEEMVRWMDQWMGRYAGLAVEKLPQASPSCPGVGAAGGLGFAFLTFLHASLESGIEIILKETGLEEKIRNADIVVTGEGRLDGQSVMGKAPIGVARLSKKYGKPVLAFAGSLGKDVKACNEYGIDAYFSILPRIVTLEEAMEPQNAKRHMADAVEQAFRLMGVWQRTFL